jgi:predicted acyltransferase
MDMKQRLESLDALRGVAILTMVLSGSIAFGGVLPGWMYHAQVPPPAHAFDPNHPGITWVDLVFPFFLFSMGAAFPQVIRQPITRQTFPNLFWAAFRRFGLLLFFALFTQHFKAWVLSDQPQLREQIHSIVAFVLLFVVLFDWKGISSSRTRTVLRITALLISVVWMTQMHYVKGTDFDLYRSDIIIVVLANMAFFGTIIYGLTQNRPWVRVAILPIIMAIFFAAKQEGWVKEFYSFHSIGSFQFDWAYKFYFLKYLFIVIPGMFAGEWLIRLREEPIRPSSNTLIAAALSVLLIVWNLYGLYTRQLNLNLAGNLMILAGLHLMIRRSGSASLRRMLEAGTYLLVLGLCFESFEGGIKKDPSNYSYYFVCSGLAFTALIAFEGFRDRFLSGNVVRYLSLQGQNPMVAYVAGSLILLPLMTLTGVKSYWEGMHQNAWMGFAKGLIFTGLVALITYLFVKRRWFWRT